MWGLIPQLEKKKVVLTCFTSPLFITLIIILVRLEVV